MKAIQSKTGLTGTIKLELLDKDGKVIQTQIIKNLIMNLGKAATAGLLNGQVTSFIRYIAIGTDSTAAAATQTALLAEITTGGGSRTAATPSRVTTTVTNDTARFVANWTFSAGFTIREIALLDSASLGVMFARQVVNQTVTNGQGLQATWDIAVS